MSKTYVIADIHGRYDLLSLALERIEANQSGGTVVFTGDYVDRGPASKQVMRRLMSGPFGDHWTWVCLKGNHEDMMVAACRGIADIGWWIGNGGSQTLQSFKRWGTRSLSRLGRFAPTVACGQAPCLRSCWR